MVLLARDSEHRFEALEPALFRAGCIEKEVLTCRERMLEDKWIVDRLRKEENDHAQVKQPSKAAEKQADRRFWMKAVSLEASP